MSVFGYHVALETNYRGALGACFRRRNLRNPGFTAQINVRPCPEFRERPLSTWGRLVRVSVFGYHVALEINYREAPGACFRRRNLESGFHCSNQRPSVP